ncbi:MAG TPA: M28 family peptidase [Gemmatimonadales bacterium]
MPSRSRTVVPTVLLAAACAPAGSAPTPLPDPAARIEARVARTAPAITVEDLRYRLNLFAHDSMLGREAGTLGNAKATDYLAQELRRMGVEPAGENGTYFQTLPLYQRVADTTRTLTVDGTPLTRGPDYLVIPNLGYAFPFGMSATFDSTPIVFGGPLGSPDALAPETAAGRFVVFGAPTSPGDVIGMINALPARYPDAAGIALAFLEFLSPTEVSGLTTPQGTREVDLPTGPVGVLITMNTAARMLGTPLGGATVGRGTGALDGVAGFVVLPLPYPARNVVGIVRGSDPAMSHQFVAIGAHNDHEGIRTPAVDHDSLRVFNKVMRPQGAEDSQRTPTAAEQARITTLLQNARRTGFPRPDSVMNGADDDASGSMTVLEIAEALAAAPRKPRRSILFVWHTGEEKELLGSEYFTDNPTVPRDSIVAQINLDMVGRGGADDLAGGGPGYMQVIGSRRLSTELGDLVESVNTGGGHGFAFDYQYDADGHPQQFYCRSDHYEYARFGIPVAFFSTGSHQDYHMVTDEPQYLDYPKMHRVTGFVFDLVTTVADLDHRIVVDKPKPDPSAPCRQ